MHSTAYPRHQRLRGLLVAALCTGLLSSCGLLRDVSHPDDETTRTETRQESGVNPRLAAFQSDPAYGPMLKGNLQAEILIGKETYSSKVNATIVRGQGIYWSVVPFPLIEAARVWFTPQGVTAIDKIHGRYAEVIERLRASADSSSREPSRASMTFTEPASVRADTGPVVVPMRTDPARVLRRRAAGRARRAR